MNVVLTPDLEQLIEAKITSGQFTTPAEVIREALRLLHERDNRLDELRRDIAIGIAEADQGLTAPLDAQATLTRIRERRAAEAG